MELDLLNIKNELKYTKNYNEIKDDKNNNWILNTNVYLNSNNEQITQKIENVIDNKFYNLFHVEPKPKKLNKRHELILENFNLLNKLNDDLKDFEETKKKLQQQNLDFSKKENENKKKAFDKHKKKKIKNQENKIKNENWEIKKKEFNELIENVINSKFNKDENNENLNQNLNLFNNDFNLNNINNQINQIKHNKIEKIKKQIEEEEKKRKEEEEKKRKEEEKKRKEEEERKKKEEEKKRKEEEERKINEKKIELERKRKINEEKKIDITHNNNKNEYLYSKLNESNGFIPIYNNVIENLNQNITNEQLYNYLIDDSLLFNTNKFSEKLYFLSLFYQKFKEKINLLNENEDAKKYYLSYLKDFSDIFSLIDSKNDINKENKLIIYFNEIKDMKELFIVVCNIFLGLIFQGIKDKKDYKYLILFSMMINKFKSNKILINLFFQKITNVCPYLLPYYHKENLIIKNGYKEGETISDFVFRQSTYLKLFFCYIYLNIQEYINYIKEYFNYMEHIEINYITARAFQIYISFFGKIIFNFEGKEKIKNLYNKFDKAIEQEKQNSKIKGLNTIDVETGYSLKEDIKKIFKNDLTEFEREFNKLN